MAGRGRPRFNPTATQRRKVEELIACGMPVADIACAIAVDEKTLRLHFATELSSGRAHRRAEVIGLLFASARKGNVSAQKQLAQVTALASAEASFTDEAPRRPAKLGKKAEADQAALAAGEGSDWGEDLKPGIRPN